IALCMSRFRGNVARPTPWLSWLSCLVVRGGWVSPLVEREMCAGCRCSIFFFGDGRVCLVLVLLFQLLYRLSDAPATYLRLGPPVGVPVERPPEPVRRCPKC